MGVASSGIRAGWVEESAEYGYVPQGVRSSGWHITKANPTTCQCALQHIQFSCSLARYSAVRAFVRLCWQWKHGCFATLIIMLCVRLLVCMCECVWVWQRSMVIRYDRRQSGWFGMDGYRNGASIVRCADAVFSILLPSPNEMWHLPLSKQSSLFASPVRNGRSFLDIYLKSGWCDSEIVIRLLLL